MNERIRELHNRACRLDMEQYPNAIPDGERIQQKFAELIVRECIVRAEREWIRNGSDTEHNQAVSKVIDSIKQHFGVEE